MWNCTPDSFYILKERTATSAKFVYVWMCVWWKKCYLKTKCNTNIQQWCRWLQTIWAVTTLMTSIKLIAKSVATKPIHRAFKTLFLYCLSHYYVHVPQPQVIQLVSFKWKKYHYFMRYLKTTKTNFYDKKRFVEYRLFTDQWMSFGLTDLLWLLTTPH